MPIKFKKREKTDCIRVDCKLIGGLEFPRLKRKVRQMGLLDTGYHIVIYKDGNYVYDRDIEAVAQPDFVDYDKSIYVWVDALNPKKISDAQKITLNALEFEYKLPIKYNEV